MSHRGVRGSSIAVVLVLAMFASGCSYLFVQNPRTVATKCTTSQLAPMLDSGMAIVSTGAALQSLVLAFTTRNGELFLASTGINAAIAGVTIPSANHGFTTVRACHRHRTNTWIDRAIEDERESRRESTTSEPADGEEDTTPPDEARDEPSGEAEPTSGEEEDADGEDENPCATESARRCTDDSGCLSGDACHPEKNRCVPEKCIDAPPE